METTEGPLAGLRVVELAGLGPGPYACLLLAELGADVIRVDRPERTGLPVAPSTTLARSRPSLALDLKSDAGRDTLLRVVDTADVLIEGLRPGVTERLGIGPDTCLARNERLVYARMTGWGQEGPLAQRVGHDINYSALSGALHATGTADKPLQAVNLLADFGGGAMFLVMGVLAAIHERTTSGRGQVVDVAMVDGAASLMTMVYRLNAGGHWKDRRAANLLDGGAPFYDTYRCADGKHVSVGALEPPFYAELVATLGLELDGEQYDEDAWPAHRSAFEKSFATRTRDEWAEVFQDRDACVAPVLGVEEAPHHPHMAARGVFVPVEGGYEPVVAPRFSRTPGKPPTPPRTPGQDTTDILAAAGFTEREIITLIESGVVRQTSG